MPHPRNDDQLKRADRDSLRRVLGVIGHQKRRRLLLALAEGAGDVKALCDLTQLSRSAVRSHLFHLADVDMVRIDRTTRPHAYSLTPEIRVRRRQGQLFIRVQLAGGQSVKIVTAQ